MKRLYNAGPTSINHDHPVPKILKKKRKLSHTDASIQATNGISEPNGWNGTFAKATDPYALMRDCRSSSRYDGSIVHTFDTSDVGFRLTAQHYLWKDLLGFLVHPNIPTGADDLKVADVATGNGYVPL